MLIHKFSFAFRAACCAGLLAVTACAHAQTPAPIPVDAFFQKPAISDAQISPDGKYVALRVAAKGGRAQLVVLDTATQAAKVAAGFKDGDVGFFQWVNSDRLLFRVNDQDAPEGEQFYFSNLFAVDRDGTDLRSLTDQQQGMVINNVRERNVLDMNTRFVSATYLKNSDDIFVTVPVFDSSNQLDARNILRLDTKTGRTAPFQRPGKSRSWLMGADDIPRVTTTLENGRSAVHYLDPATKQWKSLVEFDGYTGAGGFTPFALLPDGSLFATTSRGDTQGLYRYDFAKGELERDPVVGLKGFDFRGKLITGKEGVLGVRYTTDAETTVWFDAKWKAVQAKVDGALKSTINRLDVPVRPATPFAVVKAYSDVEPGVYFLVNSETGKFTPLGNAMRDIDARRMAPRDFVKYTARDGLPIPAWLTVPRGAKGKQSPMVVLVHGGPWERGGDWEWEAQSQFLASRGYVVLQPEFRGSAGYGYRHLHAGFKQWGLAMQDDIADGVKWAIAQGLADPKRVCIAGASYGGYATLMGLVNDPELFKCGVDWVGVTDIDLMYTPGWSDASNQYMQYGMPVLIGDPQKDAEQLRKTSPLQQASRIKQPLLLAYGTNDKRVPIMQGVKFRDAVMKTNQNVEWIEYKDEGHGWVRPANTVDFWTRVEKFLAKNIGTP